MSATYAMSGNGMVKRIRSPHPHDVLSGRGGGINSHIGNKTFRDWVRERKEAYNLAPSKADKAVVANEVIALVKALNPPGRFLQRDPNSSSNSSCWIEVDEARALAKTSQALREGAPQIRAAHKDELEQNRARKPRRKKASATATTGTTTPSSTRPAATTTQTSTTPSSSSALPHSVNANSRTPSTTIYTTNTTFQPTDSQTGRMLPGRPREVSSVSASHVVAPLMSNSEFDEAYGRSSKRPRVVMDDHHNGEEPPFSASAETPPLTSVPAPRIAIPPLRASFEAAVKLADGNNNKLKRSHSLALSDLSAGDVSGADDDFVNPFADESDLLLANHSKPNTPRGNLRNISSGEPQGGDGSNGFRSRSSIGSWSTSKSITELSDLPDYSYQPYQHGTTDFGEGMKLVYDAVHPDLTSPDEKDDWIPTHLAPWRGGTSFLRRPNALSPRSSGSGGASRRLNGRQ